MFVSHQVMCGMIATVLPCVMVILETDFDSGVCFLLSCFFSFSILFWNIVAIAVIDFVASAAVKIWGYVRLWVMWGKLRYVWTGLRMYRLVGTCSLWIWFCISCAAYIILMSWLTACVRGYIQEFPDWVDNEVTLTKINTRWEAVQRVMAAKLTRLNHNCDTAVSSSSSRSRRPVRKLLDTLSYFHLCGPNCSFLCWTILDIAFVEFAAFASVNVSVWGNLAWLGCVRLGFVG
jgi:hypothetical protein